MLDLQKVNSILNTNLNAEELKMIYMIDLSNPEDENANYIEDNFIQCANCHGWTRKTDIQNESIELCNSCYNEILQNNNERDFEIMQWYIDHHKK